MPPTTDLSPSKTLQPATPLALVAEDNISLREITVQRLQAGGVASVTVSSFSQATDALKVSPPVDVALLDIHLDPDKDRENRGGIEIARHLRATSPTTRIIGYTSEGSLSPAETNLFDDTMAKGGLSHNDHKKLWALCKRYARESYEARRDSALLHQEKLRRTYEVEIPELEVLRRLRMEEPDPPREFTAEGALGLAGYRVKVVSLSLPDRDQEKSRPFVVWEQRVREGSEDWVNLEVYGHPRLYATGPNEAEALESLAAFIALTHRDLDDIAKPLAEDAPLKRFLSSLYSSS